MWVIFAILDSGSEYTDLVESGSKHCFLCGVIIFFKNLTLCYFLGQLPGCSPQQETKRFNSFLQQVPYLLFCPILFLVLLVRFLEWPVLPLKGTVKGPERGERVVSTDRSLKTLHFRQIKKKILKDPGPLHSIKRF